MNKEDVLTLMERLRTIGIAIETEDEFYTHLTYLEDWVKENISGNEIILHINGV